jgi:hypothetical protein
MTKLTVAFRNFAKAPKMKVISMPEKFSMYFNNIINLFEIYFDLILPTSSVNP